MLLAFIKSLTILNVNTKCTETVAQLTFMYLNPQPHDHILSNKAVNL